MKEAQSKGGTLRSRTVGLSSYLELDLRRISKIKGRGVVGRLTLCPSKGTPLKDCTITYEFPLEL